MSLVSNHISGENNQYGINMIAAIQQLLTVEVQPQTIEIISSAMVMVLLSNQF
jgi:hypothetical protein